MRGRTPVLLDGGPGEGKPIPDPLAAERTPSNHDKPPAFTCHSSFFPHLSRAMLLHLGFPNVS